MYINMWRILVYDRLHQLVFVCAQEKRHTCTMNNSNIIVFIEIEDLLWFESAKSDNVSRTMSSTALQRVIYSCITCGFILGQVWNSDLERRCEN